NIGKVYHARGEFDRAMEFYGKHLEIAEQTGDRRGMGAALGNIGRVYHDKGELDRALEFHVKQLKISEQLSELPGMGTASFNIGLVCRDKGDPDRSLELHRKFLLVSRQVGYKEGIRNIASAIASTLLSVGDFRGAEESCAEALRAAKEMGAKTAEASILSLKATIARRRACHSELGSESPPTPGGPLRVRDSSRTVDCHSRESGNPPATGGRGPDHAVSEVPPGEGGVQRASISPQAEKGATEEAMAACRAALQMHRDALRLAEESGATRKDRAAILIEICRDAVEIGESEAALNALAEAAKLAGETQDFGLRTELDAASARCELAFGDKTKARKMYGDLAALLDSKGYLLRARELEQEGRT
ncbi:MAG: tetratricopeptide repeat protein, partial [Planctomycetota bacterium]|nr:tetratricopeptide repeat protein [Planctomycetota bacterium]